MRHGWKRYPIQTKLFCCLLLFLVMNLSALLVLGLSFNQSMNVVDKRLQDYYNITAFSDAFISADDLLECVTQRGADPGKHLSAFTQQRREADRYLEKITGRPSDTPEWRTRVTRIASDYAAYMEEADTLFALLPERERGTLSRRYFEVCLPLGSALQKDIPELLMQEIAGSRRQYAESREQVNTLLAGGITVYAAAHLVSAVLLICLLRKGFFSPVRQIVSAMQRMEAGDFTADDVPVRSEDEMGQLITGFNMMKHATGTLVTTLREKNELERELHLREKEAAKAHRQLELARYAKLKSQVNPHFLFNTLNIISRVAREEGAPDTEHLIVSLARLFRYSLETDAPHVSLAREIKCVNDYIRIQEIRFGDRLRFCWRIDPGLEPDEVLVVPYTLQPFVENAVIHGLRDTTEGGLLRITLRMSRGALVALVTDNGCGMSGEQLARLREEAAPGEDGHIGISNVRSRLRHFQPSSRLLLYARPGLGTCVKLVIPQEERPLEDTGSG